MLTVTSEFTAPPCTCAPPALPCSCAPAGLPGACPHAALHLHLPSCCAAVPCTCRALPALMLRCPAPAPARTLRRPHLSRPAAHSMLPALALALCAGELPLCVQGGASASPVSVVVGLSAGATGGSCLACSALLQARPWSSDWVWTLQRPSGRASSTGDYRCCCSPAERGLLAAAAEWCCQTNP